MRVLFLKLAVRPQEGLEVARMFRSSQRVRYIEGIFSLRFVALVGLPAIHFVNMGFGGLSLLRSFLLLLKSFPPETTAGVSLLAGFIFHSSDSGVFLVNFWFVDDNHAWKRC